MNDLFRNPWEDNENQNNIEIDIPEAVSIQIGNTEEVIDNNTSIITEEVNSNEEIIIPSNDVEIPYADDQFQSFDEQLIKKQQKYNIFDLFWIFDKDYKELTDTNNAHGIIISYNVDFGNLRIDFYKHSKTSIQDNIIFQQELDRIANIVIYPYDAYNILEHCYMYNDNFKAKEITCTHQLISNTKEKWINELYKCIIVFDPKKTDDGKTIDDLYNSGMSYKDIKNHEIYKSILLKNDVIILYVLNNKNEIVTYFPLKYNNDVECFSRALDFCSDKGFLLRSKK